MEYDEDGSLDETDDGINAYANIDWGGHTGVPGKLTFKVPEAGKKISENLELSGKIEIEIPDITCIVNADVGLLSGVSLNEFTFSITEKIKMQEFLTYKLAESGYELTNGAVYSIAEKGTYSYYVHDYSNRYSSSSGALSESEAKVQVYVGDILYYTFNVPTGMSGTVWHVFDYDAEANAVVPVNSFSYSSNPQTLRAYSGSLEELMLEEIASGPEKKRSERRKKIQNLKIQNLRMSIRSPKTQRQLRI